MDVEKKVAIDALLNMPITTKKTEDRKLEKYNRDMDAMDILGLHKILPPSYPMGVLEHVFSTALALTDTANIKVKITKGKFRSNKKEIDVGGSEEEKPKKYVLEGQDYNMKITLTNEGLPAKYFKLLANILQSSCYWVDSEKGLTATDPTTGHTLLIYAQYAGCVIDTEQLDKGVLSMILALDEDQQEINKNTYGTWNTSKKCTKRFDGLKLDFILGSLGTSGAL